MLSLEAPRTNTKTKTNKQPAVRDVLLHNKMALSLPHKLPRRNRRLCPSAYEYGTGAPEVADSWCVKGA